MKLEFTGLRVTQKPDKMKLTPFSACPCMRATSPIASLVLAGSFEKLPDQITYPYAEPYDLQKHTSATNLSVLVGGPGWSKTGSKGLETQPDVLRAVFPKWFPTLPALKYWCREESGGEGQKVCNSVTPSSLYLLGLWVCKLETLLGGKVAGLPHIARNLKQGKFQMEFKEMKGFITGFGPEVIDTFPFTIWGRQRRQYYPLTCRKPIRLSQWSPAVTKVLGSRCSKVFDNALKVHITPTAKVPRYTADKGQQRSPAKMDLFRFSRTLDRYTNFYLPVIGGLVYCKSCALEHPATEAGIEGLVRMKGCLGYRVGVGKPIGLSNRVRREMRLDPALYPSLGSVWWSQDAIHYPPHSLNDTKTATEKSGFESFPGVLMLFIPKYFTTLSPEKYEYGDARLRGWTQIQFSPGQRSENSETRPFLKLNIHSENGRNDNLDLSLSVPQHSYGYNMGDQACSFMKQAPDDSTEEEKMLLAAVLEDEDNLEGGVIFTKPSLALFNMEPKLRYAHAQRKMARDGRWENWPASNLKKT
uniref:Uncharacterized protein n=1 Tax=Timema douglasi TaxID=61478 RepID=A0A7R8VCE0_TIMDO|nr:unnamed protein product [Timema douglasi]